MCLLFLISVTCVPNTLCLGIFLLSHEKDKIYIDLHINPGDRIYSLRN